MTACELARVSTAILEGKQLSPFQVRFLNENGIPPSLASKIGEQVKKYASEDGGIRQLNLAQWDDQFVGDAVRRVLYDHGVGATMLPEADLPPLFRSPLGKMLIQFRSFATATFNRMFMYSLENGQQLAANTIAQCMLLDTFGKMCKSIGKYGSTVGEDPGTGKIREFDALDIAMRALNDSISSNDWASWAFDPLGIMQAITHPRTPANQFGGVSAALIRDIGGGARYISARASGGTPSKPDEKALWRLLPFQNWWGIRAGIASWRAWNKQFNSGEQ
jgi:hypothetical protein